VIGLLREQALDVGADPVDRIAARWLRDGAIEGELRDHPDAVRRVSTWLEDCEWLVPPVAAVRQQLDRFELRQRLERAIGPVFIGRERELDQLERCIGDGTMLAIDARGGMGKSALLARALLNAGAYEDTGPLVAWLDFDNPLVDVREPETIILELARQIALQNPELRSFEATLRDELDAYRRSSASGDAAHHRDVEDDRVWFVARYFLTRVALSRRLVVILDTFERTRHLSATLSAQFLNGLVPALREAHGVCSWPGAARWSSRRS
jgi:hypothetical protein